MFQSLLAGGMRHQRLTLRTGRVHTAASPPATAATAAGERAHEMLFGMMPGLIKFP